MTFIYKGVISSIRKSFQIPPSKMCHGLFVFLINDAISHLHLADGGQETGNKDTKPVVSQL